ncbi:hypothetical protein [Nocardia aurantiaca]|uniref:Uncharacterized protein n=1 Tax=Nocardia aurantiaca TaxID=2675850 RepID=A0A6I3KT59_9NOCA|nr:hypothetical protein [Nocardia aurantiaca]MTE13943.1 hypothetical protein [Nocardia aurantiaca]
MKKPAAAHPAPPLTERPDLTAWRHRHALRRSNASQPIPSGRRYNRTTKHRNRDQDSWSGARRLP